MKALQEKKCYQPPKVTMVEFKVEEGFTSIVLGLELLPFYDPAANSGSGFWGGTSSGGSSTSGYGGTGFAWGGDDSPGSGNTDGYSGFGWEW